MVKADFPQQLSGLKCVKPAVKPTSLSLKELLMWSCLREVGVGDKPEKGEEVQELGETGVTDGGREREGLRERNGKKQRD